VVVDACITMDRLKDYVSVEDSRLVESYMASAISSYLNNVGYKVSKPCMPFVGSYKSAEQTFVVKQQRKDKAVEAHPPFFTEEVGLENATCQAAFARVTREVSRVVEQKASPPADVFRANQTIRADLQLLQSHLQKRYLLVVIGDGKSVPGFTSFAQGMATGMATGILTGGLVVVTACDVTYIDTCAAIIDLAEGELLWSNTLRLQGGKIGREDYYSTWNEKLRTYNGWVQSVLFYVPVQPGPLIEAAKKGENGILEWMVLTGANLDEGDGSHMTGLHWACQNGHLKTLELLAKHGASVNCQDVEGDTPLHHAARAGKSNVVKALLKLKADVHAKNARGETPLDIATSQQNKKMVKMLTKQS
jgi:hypothetical protein